MCRHFDFRTRSLTDALGITHSRREEAGRRYDERKSYIFDLDVRESAEDEDEDETEKFSVDGHAYGTPSCPPFSRPERQMLMYGSTTGNWTRFVKYVIPISISSVHRLSIHLTATRASLT